MDNLAAWGVMYGIKMMIIGTAIAGVIIGGVIVGGIWIICSLF